MTVRWWDDLSSSEIKRRLIQHGLDQYQAQFLIDRRDRVDASALITMHLEGRASRR